MALSMDEQRILDGMERKLADEDPRLASRLAAFGQPRLPVLLGSGRARAAFVLISLALAAMVALMVYSMRPYPAGQAKHSPGTTQSRSAPSAQASGSKQAKSST
jgi:hypothetical protein